METFSLIDLKRDCNQCCKLDGGRPSVVAVQAESTNRLKGAGEVIFWYRAFKEKAW